MDNTGVGEGRTWVEGGHGLTQSVIMIDDYMHGSTMSSMTNIH